MFELFALATLMLIAALLAWWGLRAWRTKNGLVKGAVLAWRRCCRPPPP